MTTRRLHIGNILLRDGLVLFQCLIGVGLIWPVKLAGLPLGSALWLLVTLLLHVQLARCDRSGEPITVSLRSPWPQLTRAALLSLANDLLLLLLLGLALLLGLFIELDFRHYALVGALLLLICAWWPVNIRLGRV